MFGRNRRQKPDLETGSEGFRKWEDKMFPNKIHFTGHQAVSSIVEVAAQMEAVGADPLDIELLPDRAAYLLDSAAECTDIIAPPLYPE